ncbi:MAG: hypothetical protein ACOC06_00555 [Halorubrum sp.]
MSASTPPVGIDHPTVVPANFDPERRDVDLDEPASDADGDREA